MADTDSIEEAKLLQLLEAVESVVENEDAEEMLGIEMLNKFSDIQTLVRGWLLHESPLTHADRVLALTVFNDILEHRQRALDRGNAKLH